MVARLADLKAEHVERSAITVDTIISELNEARELAKRINNPSAMVCASMAKAKLLGFEKPDQHKTDVVFINKPLATPGPQIEMSVEEWMAKWSPKEIKQRPDVKCLRPSENGDGKNHYQGRHGRAVHG